jgi:hypothetical protein
MMMNFSPRRLAGTTLAALSVLALSIGAANAAKRTDFEGPRGNIKRIVVQEALASNVPPSLALAVAKVESDFQSSALSSKGARGVMQIMPATAMGEWGVEADELWDPRTNVRLGIDFLEGLIDRYEGNWEYALSYYNGGSKVGEPDQARVLPWTRDYVDNVLRWERRYATQEKVWLALVKREHASGYRKSRARRWLPREERVSGKDILSTASEIARAEAEAGDMDSEANYNRYQRPRVKWTNEPRRKKSRKRQAKNRYAKNRYTNKTKRRSARKSSRRYSSDRSFSNIDERLRAVRGTLDDFSAHNSDDG